jgi:hypothetical protein
LVIGEKDGWPLLVVAPSRSDLTLSIVKGQTDPYYEGWHLQSADEGTPAPALLYEWDEAGSTAVETVIWPVPPNDSGNLAIDRRIADGIIELTITRDNRIDVIFCGPGHDIAFRRSRAGECMAAGGGGGGGASLEIDSLTLQPRRPGAAYIESVGRKRCRTSSNCDARTLLDGWAVKTVPWEGR